MITRTSIQADFGRRSSISLRAEILLLSIITIFGIIGLSFCIGLYGDCDDYSALLQKDTKTETLIYDRQIET